MDADESRARETTRDGRSRLFRRASRRNSAGVTHGVRAVPGTVYLVGAGPGNPDLLTLRAARVISQADVIVHDRLVAPEIVALAPPRAIRIDVGKARSNHTLPQPEISDLLVRLAHRHARVVRLKGGDPFVFGRGGEEIAVLGAQRIPFEVVPGVTAALGVAAYAGIPLTHRDCAHAVTLVTGHLKDGTMDLDWPALARRGQTLVVYMGLHGLPIVCRELVAHGLASSTPAAIVEHGTTVRQRVVAATLADLPERAHAARIESPALLIVGDVVALRATLDWYGEALAARSAFAAAGD